VYRPGGCETIPPAADGSSTVAKIAADLRPSEDGSAVRTFLVASLGSCAMGQTDGQTDGRIAISLNAQPSYLRAGV